MVESNPHIERSGRKLVFASGEPLFNSVGSLILVIVSAIFVIAIYVLAPGGAVAPSASENGGIFIFLLFFAGIAFHLATRQWIAEIDLTARWIKITRRSFGRWTKAVVDCPLDECTAFGTIEYNTDGHITYGTYVEMKDGRRHAIPLADSSFAEAAKVASKLSTATGIPRLDTIF